MMVRDRISRRMMKREAQRTGSKLIQFFINGRLMGCGYGGVVNGATGRAGGSSAASLFGATHTPELIAWILK